MMNADQDGQLNLVTPVSNKKPSYLQEMENLENDRKRFLIAQVPMLSSAFLLPCTQSCHMPRRDDASSSEAPSSHPALTTGFAI